TGCGAVAISLAAESGIEVIGTDVSLDALRLAAENARRLGLAGSVRLVQSDLLAGVRGPFDVVLANLPYVPRGRVLPRDVGEYEPTVALYAGLRGTELIERLLGEARPVLAGDAELAVELDEEGQAEPIAALARQLYPRASVGIHQDAGGYDRVVRLQLSPPGD
ncbi:MAG TPA: methyltransferase, partial [Chloroflexota bacterium]